MPQPRKPPTIRYALRAITKTATIKPSQTPRRSLAMSALTSAHSAFISRRSRSWRCSASASAMARMRSAEPGSAFSYACNDPGGGRGPLQWAETERDLSSVRLATERASSDEELFCSSLKPLRVLQLRTDSLRFEDRGRHAPSRLPRLPQRFCVWHDAPAVCGRCPHGSCHPNPLAAPHHEGRSV